MKLTTAEGYALRAMVFLAKNYESNKAYSLSEVAEKEQLPFPFLEQIFRALKKHKLVSAQRGAQGGYCLNREPQAVNVLQIVEAVSGKLSLIACNKEYCPAGKCSVVPLLDKLQANIEQTLGETKLAELI